MSFGMGMPASTAATLGTMADSAVSAAVFAPVPCYRPGPPDAGLLPGDAYARSRRLIHSGLAESTSISSCQWPVFTACAIISATELGENGLLK